MPKYTCNAIIQLRVNSEIDALSYKRAMTKFMHYLNGGNYDRQILRLLVNREAKIRPVINYKAPKKFQIEEEKE